MSELPIRCSCGLVSAIATNVRPGSVNRMVCHCRGCTAYAHAFGRQTEILDPHGGTEVVQMSPRRLRFTSGIEHVGCVQMSDAGALRWIANCCKTPLAHTLPSLRLPFLAVNHLCIVWPAGASKEALVGPIRARVNGRFSGSQAVKLGAGRGDLLAMLLHYVPRFLGWLVRGDARHSAFLDRPGGKPIASPTRMFDVPNEVQES